MLKGTLKYNDGENSCQADIFVRHSGKILMYLQPCYTVLSGAADFYSVVNKLTKKPTTTAKAKKGETVTEISDAVVTDGDDWRRLDVTLTNSVKTNINNVQMSVRVGGLLCYAMREAVNLLQLENKQSLEKVYNNNTPFEVYDSEGKKLGSYTTCLGVLTEMHISNSYVTIDLQECADSEVIVKCFSDLKQKDKYGHILSQTKVYTAKFPMIKDVLGFDYVPATHNVEYGEGDTSLMYKSLEDVVSAHPYKHFAQILQTKHYTIVDDSNVDVIMAEFYAYDGLIAIDTETTGLSINKDSRNGTGDQLVGICMSKEIGVSYYFPLRMNKIKNLCNGDHVTFMEKYMRKFLETHKFITHNLSFDWKVFYIYDIDLNAVYDTKVIVDCTEKYKNKNYSDALKELSHNVLNQDMFDLDDFVVNGDWSSSGMSFADLPYEFVKYYAPTDADSTLALCDYFIKTRIIEKYGVASVVQIETDYAKVIGYSEFYGYHVDIDSLPQLSKDIEEGMKKNYAKMVELAGMEFNPASPKQLGNIIYNVLNYPDISNKRSTDKETIKQLSDITDDNGECLYPFMKYLKEYRQNAGIFNGFLAKKDKFISPEGFIYPNVYSFGTVTGRSSIKEPNYQSYNDPVKKKIIPRRGFKIFDCDFAQIEYRVLASMSHEQALIDAFNNPDTDYHQLQASRMYKILYSAVTKAMRQATKKINFGIVYGMADSTLGMNLFGKRTPENKRKAGEMRKIYFEGQDNVLRFMTNAQETAVNKLVTQTLFGRPRFYSLATSDPNTIRRYGGNHLIQGTAADIYKIACIRMFKMIKAKGWMGKVLIDCFVHDEILGEVSEEINFFEFVEAWRMSFQVEIEGFCKLYAGLGIGNHWYEAKKADWTPQFVDEIINSPLRSEWDSWDGDKFIKWSKKAFYDHETNRVYKACKENIERTAPLKPADKVIHSVIDNLLKSKIGDLLIEHKDDLEFLSDFSVGLSVPIKVEKDTAKNAKKDDYVHNIKDLQDYLKIFCKWKDLDYAKLDIISAEDLKDYDTPAEVQAQHAPKEDLSVPDMSVDEFIKVQLEMQGYACDYDSGIFYLHLTDSFKNPTIATNFINNFSKQDGGFLLYLVDTTGDGYIKYATTYKISSMDFFQIQVFITQLRKGITAPVVC